jgi:hypothetical protein
MLQFYGFGLNSSYSHEDLANFKTRPPPPGADDDANGTSSKPNVKYRGPLIGESPDFTRRANATWLKTSDHNHLRLTRIIRSLRVLGLEVLAQAFYEELMTGENRNKVGKRSRMFWKRAATRELWLAPSDDDVQAEGVKWLRGEILAERGMFETGQKSAMESSNGVREEGAEEDKQVKAEGMGEGVVKHEGEDYVRPT